MKRFFILSVAMVVASSSFAYYESYSSSESSGWTTFIGIVMIVWGVLEIILFFKVWGMTNDIKVLKKDYFNETIFETKTDMLGHLRRNLVLGNMENVQRIFLQNFMNNVECGFEALPTFGYVKNGDGHEERTDFREKNLKETIRPYVESLQKQYNKIGAEIPVYIQRMETFGDYYELFVEKDLAVEVEKNSDNKEV